MTRLTELRITHELDEDDSLEALAMLQKLAIDYQYMETYLTLVLMVVVVSDAAKLAELRKTVHKKVSKDPRSLCFVAKDQSPTWTILCELNGQSC